MSLYRGSTKLYGKKYQKCSLIKATNKDGDACCPSCRMATIKFMGEHCQYGMDGRNVYQEFNLCLSCGHRFVIGMVRTEEDYYGKWDA